MPIYEYECGQCSLHFELKRHFGENSGAMCPLCQGSAQRVFTPVPIIFKGPGFYVTDSRGRDSKRDHRHDGEERGSGTKSPTPHESPVAA